MWNQRYNRPEFVYGTQPNDFLVSVLESIPHGKLLSLGEGEGRNAVYLASQGFKVSAVDSSDAGLSKARRLADEKGVHITTITADLGDFEIAENSWDAIISIFCHIPSSLRVPLHKAVVQGLKHGGVFVLEAFIPRQLEMKTGGPTSLNTLMTLASLRQELAGLRFLHALEIDRNLVEGIFHTGQAAVVQILAVKDAE
ncbi:MAG: class I SAM-dependent methyltransferase [Chloroflexi bacterium]|nr:class I SAM-dependent methyltransferase [Chloroflexota bacterium]